MLNKLLTFVLIFFTCKGYSQSLSQLDLVEICGGMNSKESSSGELPKTSLKVASIDGKDLMILDKGFCQRFLSSQTEVLTEEVVGLVNSNLSPANPSYCSMEDLNASFKINPKNDSKTDKWKIRFYASHSFTTYFNSDISFRSSRYNVDVKDYAWAERGSREFFTLEEWKKPGSNIFQMIDEPTNTFTISIEKNGNEFFLSAFHPKFLQADNQVKFMKGEIDGIAVNGFAPINRPFDGYNQLPGEMELVRNQNTHLQMNYEVGYGKRFNLMNNNFGKISYVPSVGVGVMAGQNQTVVIQKDQWWEFDHYVDQNKIQGYGGSISNRIEYNTKKERVGVFYENKLGYYQMNHGFMDGNQKYDLKFMGNSFGLKFMIYDPNNKKDKNISKGLE